MEKMSKELKYYYKNRAERIKASIKYAKEHPDQAKIGRNKYMASPKGIYSQIKKNCQKRNRALIMTREEFVGWYNSVAKSCVYCGVDEINLAINSKVFTSRYRTKRLTIDRIDNNIGYEVCNLCLACDICNTVKSDIFSFEEMQQIGLIIKNKHKTYEKQENNEEGDQKGKEAS